ncbi:hypothetical protein [Alishewanella longhuensis]
MTQMNLSLYQQRVEQQLQQLLLAKVPVTNPLHHRRTACGNPCRRHGH